MLMASAPPLLSMMTILVPRFACKDSIAVSGVQVGDFAQVYINLAWFVSSVGPSRSGQQLEKSY